MCIYNIQGKMQCQPPRLSRHGILYLTLGFKQDYTLQVLSHRRHQNTLQMVLYDGLSYIGARYSPPHLHYQPTRHPLSSSVNNQQQLEAVSEFDVVRIFPMDVRPNEPIEIQRLEVVMRRLSGLLGKEAITLQEFMRRRRFQRPIVQNIESDEEEMSPHSRKITKLFQEASFQKSNTRESIIKDENTCQQAGQNNQEEAFVIEDSPLAVEEERENSKETHNMMMIEPNSRDIIHNQPMETENQLQEKLREQIIEDMPDKHIEQATTQKNNHLFQQSLSEQPQINKSTIIDIEEDSQFTLNNKQPNTQIQAGKPSKLTISQETQYICDLYQRIHRFRLLCRINHLSHFTSQRGNLCTKLILIDEHGDQIICMIFQKQPLSKEQNKLVKGKSYIFENGEVSREEGGLSICIHLGGISEHHRFLPSFVPSKMYRLAEVEKQDDSSHYLSRAIINLEQEKPLPKKKALINVCGIFQGFKEDPKLTKNLFRVVGILCDPDHELSIHFCLLVDELTSFPQPGAVVSLHNMEVVEEEQTLSLQGKRMSYILNEAGNTHSYFSDLLQSSARGDWKLHEYRNLSQMTFVPRTINQLQQLLAGVTEQEFFYSQIEYDCYLLSCRITTMKERKSYDTCAECRREVKAEGGMFSYCFKCRKPNKHMMRILFDIELSDTTGSLTASLSSADLEGFIGMGALEYSAQSKEDRAYFLELSVYRAIVVKLKSERLVGGVRHVAVAAAKSTHKRSLAQIRAMTIDQKTKYVNPW